ncbi:MAG TPA: hypothetical protein VMW57_01545 [Methyloceanibacter sp.]|nr:hypothetical protein [Methyloceanibacter sp.]
MPWEKNRRMQDPTEGSSKRQSMTHIWPLLAVGALGVALAVAAWIAVSAWEQRLAKAKFYDVAGDYSTVLQNGLYQNVRGFSPSCRSTNQVFPMTASSLGGGTSAA